MVTSDKVVKTKDDKKGSVKELKVSDDKLVSDNQKLLSDTVRGISDQIRAKAGGDMGRHDQTYLPSTELTLSKAGLTSGIDGFTPPPQVSNLFHSAISAPNTFGPRHRFPTSSGSFLPQKGPTPGFASPSNRQFQTLIRSSLPSSLPPQPSQPPPPAPMPLSLRLPPPPTTIILNSSTTATGPNTTSHSTVYS